MLQSWGNRTFSRRVIVMMERKLKLLSHSISFKFENLEQLRDYIERSHKLSTSTEKIGKFSD